MYKIDMHVHCIEGSADAQVSIVDTAIKLRDAGYSGMLITDHNSYDGWKYYQSHQIDNFIVYKGIEITTNEGHLLLIPEDESMEDFTHMDYMPIEYFLNKALSLGYCVGIAHPYCEYYGIFGTNNHYSDGKDIDLINQVNFIEVFNPGATRTANTRAHSAALETGISTTAGSDSHEIDYVGYCATYFKSLPKNNKELIDLINNEGISSVLKKYYC